MSILESHPDLILSLAKFTTALFLGMAVAPLIKRPALRAAFWTAMFIILPTMILVTHGRSILNILPVPTVMPTVTVQMESTQSPASTPVSPPAPIVVAKPLTENPPAISAVPTNNDITKAIEAPSLTPPTPARNINWVAAVYISGLIASLLPILISILRLRFAPKKSASDTAIEVWSMIRPEETKVVPLYLTDSPAAPFTCGLIRAEVLLPESSDEWSMRRLRSTLYHESAHISRRDPLVRMFASLVRAMFWFHPLVWLAHRRLVAAQEEACDEIALAAGIPADEYAEDLLEAAKHAQGQLGHGLALARWSQLGSRIRIILQTNTKEIKQMNKKTIAIVTLGIAALCVGISSLGFNSQKPSDTKQEEEKPKFSSSRKLSSTRKSSRAPGSHSTGDSAASRSAGVADELMYRWQKINEILDTIERNRQWLQLVDSLTPKQFKAFVPLFHEEARKKPEFVDEYEKLLVAWAKADIMAAIYFAGNGDFECNTVLVTWASMDPDSAIAWAKSNHDKDSANSFMVSLIKGLAADDPVRATALLNEMPPSDKRGGEALAGLMPAILKRGIAERRAMVEAITNPTLREAAMVRVAESTASEDPQGTVNWLVAIPSESNNLAISGTIERIATADSSIAISYFNTLPAGGTRASALEGIMYAVAQENPKLAASLLENNPGNLTDYTVQIFVGKSFDTDPQGAVSRIALIKNPAFQEYVYRGKLGAWIKKDQQAAIDWVNSNTLPPNVIDQFNHNLEFIQKYGY